MRTYNPDNLTIVIERPVEIKKTAGVYNKGNPNNIKRKKRTTSKKSQSF